jgi:hypothetical protein
MLPTPHKKDLMILLEDSLSRIAEDSVVGVVVEVDIVYHLTDLIA